jgi:hypothetical protein
LYVKDIGTHTISAYKQELTFLSEKFLPDSVVLESELEGKGYTTEEQVKALIDEAAAEGGGTTSWGDITDKPEFAAVATSGSWNDLEDKPFGEGPSKWVEVVSRFRVTPTQADNGSYTATVELSFKPKDNTKYKITVRDGLWTGMVVYDHECVGNVQGNYPVLGYTRYGLGVSGDTVYAYSSVPAGTIPTRWTFEFQSYNGQNGY